VACGLVAGAIQQPPDEGKARAVLCNETSFCTGEITVQIAMIEATRKTARRSTRIKHKGSWGPRA